MSVEEKSGNFRLLHIGEKQKNEKVPLIVQLHGADDTTVTPIQTDEMVSKLKELNQDVTYTRIDGVGHNVWEYAYNRELLEWLLNKKRIK